MSIDRTQAIVKCKLTHKNCSESNESTSEAMNIYSKDYNFTKKYNAEPIQSKSEKKIQCKPINAESSACNSSSENDVEPEKNADSQTKAKQDKMVSWNQDSSDDRSHTEKKLPVELKYLGKRRQHIDQAPVVSLKVQLQTDQYLRSLYEELESIKHQSKNCTRAERMYRLRDKQNEILFYRNQEKVADYYNGRIIQSNGPDFILLPGMIIPRNLPEGFIFGIRGAVDENGRSDVILLQTIKDFNGL